MNSPALSDVSLSDEALDAYFANSYVPPSMWPTPPPITPKMAVECAGASLEEGESFTCPMTGEDLLGPATYLAALVPLMDCHRQPHVPGIALYLSRSALPLELIAYAACMLDALSSRFVPSWLDACQDVANCNLSATSSNSNLLLAPSTLRRTKQSTFLDPSLIVLAALSITYSYHQDHAFSKEFWTAFVAEEQFSTRQLNATISAILVDLGYRLQVFTPERVEEALVEMKKLERVGVQRAVGRAVEVWVERQAIDVESKGRRERPVVPGLKGTRASVWVHGQCTPEPSP